VKWGIGGRSQAGGGAAEPQQSALVVGHDGHVTCGVEVHHTLHRPDVSFLVASSSSDSNDSNSVLFDTIWRLKNSAQSSCLLHCRLETVVDLYQHSFDAFTPS
jgi:hypothetical protein